MPIIFKFVPFLVDAGWEVEWVSYFELWNLSNYEHQK